ncbi:methyltransferase domain-containing protein [Actinoplanes sp. NPDC049548]|uniref:class I SAM-dependent methyltransferase n=1 Tax=Actinoplanes sp. NPDC049548 TaxID=3155152 RepID=UPI003424DD19
MSIFKQFLAHPVLTGAIAASSPVLARAMTSELRLGEARTVVELGPGTGAFTEAVLDRLPSHGRLVAVEINSHLVKELQRRFRGRPVEIVHASAADLADLVDAPVDAVVSGLPWTVMPHRTSRAVLDAVVDVLSPTGRFTTFAYLHAAWTPPAHRFTRDLRRRFAVVRPSAPVWRNLPPAFVHHATAPLKACPAPSEGAAIVRRSPR